MFAKLLSKSWNWLLKLSDNIPPTWPAHPAAFAEWTERRIRQKAQKELEQMSDQANKYDEALAGSKTSMTPNIKWQATDAASLPYREPTRKLTFTYKNWKGVIREYTVIPIEFVFGSDTYHQPTQWLLHAYDLPRGVRRTFALNNMITPPRSENAK